VPNPQIDNLKPNSVKVNTVLTVRIRGSNFDSCRLLIDGSAHNSEFLSSTEIRAPIELDVTGTPGAKKFKLQSALNGSFSNEIVLTVA
jgi:hypothetical protein